MRVTIRATSAFPFLDTTDAAENKKLVVVAAGPDEWIDRCRPVFDAIGHRPS